MNSTRAISIITMKVVNARKTSLRWTFILPTMGWETDWQVSSSYATKPALHLANELQWQHAL